MLVPSSYLEDFPSKKVCVCVCVCVCVLGGNVSASPFLCGDLDVACLTRLQTLEGLEEVSGGGLCFLTWGIGACGHAPVPLGFQPLWPLLPLPCPCMEYSWEPGCSTGSQD